jgi:hypothetical protein
MGIQVRFIKELRVVESLFDETYEREDIKASTLEAIKIAAENGVNRYLVDCTHLAQSRSVLDIYSIGGLYVDLDIPRGSKQAVILSTNKENQKNTRFYETVARNRGYDVRVFQDRYEALAWLTSD